MRGWVVVLAACHGGGDKPAPAVASGSAKPSQFEVVKEVSVDGGAAAPQAGDEVEPNDGEDTATPLGEGATVRGKLDADGDVDFYRLDLRQAGALQLSLTAIDGFDLSLELADASGAVLAKSDRGGVRIGEGIPNFGVQPGKYLAIVRGKKAAAPKPKLKKGQKPPPEVPSGPSPVYELTAKLAQVSGNAEREPDDDRGSALDLIVGDPVSGFVGWTGDADSWKLNVEALSAKNAVDIEVGAVDGVALSLEIDNATGDKLALRKAPVGAPLVVRDFQPVVPQGGAPYHYLVVRGAKSNPDTAYALVVKAHDIAPDAEKEPNDSWDHAMPVDPDRQSLHGTWNAGDVDCFALAGDKAEVTLEVHDADLGMDLYVDGKVVAKSDHPGAGAAEKVSAAIPAGKRAAVCVRGADANTPGAGSYDIRVTE